MSSFADRFQSNNERDIIWEICFIICLCTCCIIICIYFRTMQSLYCIPRPAYSSTFEPRHIKIYSTTTITFATLSALVYFSVYPICTQWDCLTNLRLGYILSMAFQDTYALSKLFLYLIFIGRLFNPHYYRIHQYPMYIKYLLYILLIILMMALVAYNIDLGLLMNGVNVPMFVDNVSVAVYCITDISIAALCMLLFFRPICCRNARNFNVHISVAKKYCFISSLQLISAVSFQLTLLSLIYLDVRGVSDNVILKYDYIIRIIQQWDCLLLTICVYVGFVRKSETVYI